MKHTTAVFLAALAVAALSGCGLQADEYVDADGNVQQVGQAQRALLGSDPLINPDPTDAILPLPPLTFPTTPTTGSSTTGGDGTAGDPTIALPQDPIPLLDPARPGGGPRTGNGPRTGTR